MAEKLDHMPWYGARYYDDEDVKVMGDIEDAWYHRLLWHQWIHGSIPLDEVACRGIARPEFGTTAKRWHAFYDKYVKKLFPAIDEYRGQNSTVEEIRAAVMAAAEAKTEQAKLAASRRWAKQREILDANEQRK